MADSISSSSSPNFWNVTDPNNEAQHDPVMARQQRIAIRRIARERQNQQLEHASAAQSQQGRLSTQSIFQEAASHIRAPGQSLQHRMSEQDLQQRFRIGQARGVGLNCLLHTLMQHSAYHREGPQFRNPDAVAVQSLRNDLAQSNIVPNQGVIDAFGTGMMDELTERFQVRIQVFKQTPDGYYTEHPVMGRNEAHPIASILHTGGDGASGHFSPLWLHDEPASPAQAALTQGVDLDLDAEIVPDIPPNSNLFAGLQLPEPPAKRPRIDNAEPLAPPTLKESTTTKITDAQIQTIPAFKELVQRADFTVKPNIITSIAGRRSIGLGSAAMIAKALLDNIDTLNRLVGSKGTYTPANLSSMLNRAGGKAPKAVAELVTKLESLTPRLNKLGLPAATLSSMLHSAGAKAPETLEQLVTKLEDLRPRMTELGLPARNLSSMIGGARAKAPEALEQLVTELENLTPRMRELGLPAVTLSSMLNGAGAKAPEAVGKLVTKLENLRPRMKELELSAVSLSSMLNGTGAKAPETLEKLVTKLENFKPRTDKLGLPAATLFSMLSSVGAKAPETLGKLVTKLENLTPRIDKLGLPAANLSSMLSGAGAKAPETLGKLVTKLEDLKPRMDKLGLPSDNLSSMLHRAGVKAPTTLEKLVTKLETHLDEVKELIGPEKPIQFQNISHLLSSAGAHAPEALAKMMVVLKNHSEAIPDLIGPNKPFEKLSKLVRVSDRPNSALKTAERFDLALRSDHIRRLLERGQNHVGPADFDTIMQELTNNGAPLPQLDWPALAHPNPDSDIASDNFLEIDDFLGILGDSYSIASDQIDPEEIAPVDHDTNHYFI